MRSPRRAPLNFLTRAATTKLDVSHGMTAPYTNRMTAAPAPSSLLFTFADGSTLHQISARRLIAIPVWEGNRVLDEAHVDDLARSIRDPRDIQGPFSVVEYPDEEGRSQRKIIDGQHRREVLSRYFATTAATATDTTADFLILARLYKIADHAAAITIFQAINHAKPMVYKGSPTERLHEFSEALRRHCVYDRGRAGIVGLIRPCATVRPFLSQEHLEEALKRYRIHERADLTPQAVIDHAMGMNEFYAADPTAIPGRFSQASLTKAAELGFYLGLDPTCAWLAGLRKSS